MTDRQQSSRRFWPIVLVAALAGAVAGALGIYGMAGGERNGEAALEAAAPASCDGKAAVAQKLEAYASGQVAGMAPTDASLALGDLAFDGPDGEAMTIADFAGRTVLLNLWATWCVPCREEMPALDELQAATGDETFEVVAVNIDRGEESKVTNFLQEVGITDLANYRDADMAIFKDLQKQGIGLGLPVTVLIDRDGCHLAALNGPAAWSSPDAIALIEAAKAL